jgi:CBS domain-containing protein
MVAAQGCQAMKNKMVKDLMLPLDEYAVVSQDASLVEAVLALEEAQKRVKPGRQPHRAVLAVDEHGRIVGKLGHLGFLKALEPRYDAFGDLGTLSRAGLSRDFIAATMSHMELWKEGFLDLGHRARVTRLRDVMRPATESIPEDASIGEALHAILVHQVLSLLVTRGSDVVGILRLSDLYAAIAEEIKRSAATP